MTAIADMIPAATKRRADFSILVITLVWGLVEIRLLNNTKTILKKDNYSFAQKQKLNSVLNLIRANSLGSGSQKTWERSQYKKPQSSSSGLMEKLFTCCSQVSVEFVASEKKAHNLASISPQTGC